MHPLQSRQKTMGPAYLTSAAWFGMSHARSWIIRDISDLHCFELAAPTIWQAPSARSVPVSSPCCAPSATRAEQLDSVSTSGYLVEERSCSAYLAQTVAADCDMPSSSLLCRRLDVHCNYCHLAVCSCCGLRTTAASASACGVRRGRKCDARAPDALSSLARRQL